MSCLREANYWYSALGIQLVFNNMEDERRRRQVRHRQAIGLVYKYSVTSSAKQTPKCQSATLPKRRNVLLKRAKLALEVCKELFAGAMSQFVSHFAHHPPSFFSVTLKL
jgi:hypothetical protein